MSAAHFLRHLAIAYNHFHPVDEHRKFAEQLDLFEKGQLKESLSGQLDSLEKRSRIYVDTGIISQGELSCILARISEIKQRLSAGLNVLPHEGAPVV